MHPGARKSRPPARAQNARCNLTGTADRPKPRLGSEAVFESVSLRARATGARIRRFVLGRLASGVSVTWRSPRMVPFSIPGLIDFRSAKTLHFQPLMKSKLIMVIRPKLKEYLDKDRRKPKPKPTQ